MAALQKCRSCSKLVRWVDTKGGRKMPLDPDPTPRGNVVIGWDYRARVRLKNTRQCRVCGCTATDACPDALVQAHGSFDQGCSWIEQDLCSSCIGKEPVRYVAHFATCAGRGLTGKAAARAVRHVRKLAELRQAQGRTVSDDLRRQHVAGREPAHYRNR